MEQRNQDEDIFIIDDNKHVTRVDLSRLNRSHALIMDRSSRNIFGNGNLTFSPRINAIVGKKGSGKSLFASLLQSDLWKQRITHIHHHIKQTAIDTTNQLTLSFAEDDNVSNVIKRDNVHNQIPGIQNPLFEIAMVLKTCSDRRLTLQRSRDKYTTLVMNHPVDPSVIDDYNQRINTFDDKVAQFNEDLRAFGLMYQFRWDTERYKLSFVDLSTQLESDNFARLSTGEQTMLRMICYKLLTDHKNKIELPLPSILILDELDGTLDPESYLSFLEILHFLTNQCKMQIFIITHNKDIQLMTDTHFYYMEKKEKLYLKKCDKIYAYLKLNTNSRNSHHIDVPVYVEGHDDQIFYSLLYDYFMEQMYKIDGKKLKALKLKVIPSRRYRLRFISVGGKDEVKNRVGEFRVNDSVEHNLRRPYGILDGDNKLETIENVFKLPRWELENYLDEMDMWLERTTLDISDDDWNARLEKIRNWTDKQKSDTKRQNHVHSMESRGSVPPLPVIVFPSKQIQYVRYPKWYLEIKGKYLYCDPKQGDSLGLNSKILHRIGNNKNIFLPMSVDILLIFTNISVECRNQARRLIYPDNKTELPLYTREAFLQEFQRVLNLNHGDIQANNFEYPNIGDDPIEESPQIRPWCCIL